MNEKKSHSWRIEEELQKSARVNYLLTTGSAIIFSCTPSYPYTTTYISPNVKEILGYEPREFSENPEFWETNIHPEDREYLFGILEDMYEHNDQHIYQYRYRRKDGKYLWMREEVKMMRDADGAPREIIGYWVKISSRDQTVEYLRKIVETQSDAEMLAHLGSWTWDIQTGKEHWSDETFRIFGFKPHEFVPTYQHFLDASHPEDRDKVIQAVNAALEDIRPYDIELRVVRPNNEIRFVHGKGEVYRTEDGQPVKMAGTVLDITDRVKHRERLRKLATRLQTVREEEQTRIARELHDELGQMLTSLRFDLYRLLGMIPEESEDLVKEARAALHLVDQNLDTVRHISYELRPLILDDLGLKAAIEDYIHHYCKQASCQCKVELQLEDVRLDSERETAVFRILQESLTNILRHAKATCIEIAMYTTKTDLIMEIRDDGIGIDMNKLDDTLNYLGILGMQERAAAMKGQLDIEKIRENGTRLTLKIPLA